MISKVIEGLKSSFNFSVNPTLPLMDGPLMLPSKIVCISLSLTLHLVLYSPLFLLLSLCIPQYLPLLLHANINLHSCHMRPLLWSRDFLMIFRSFDQITTLTYFNLNLRSYGQLFVLVFIFVQSTKAGKSTIHKSYNVRY